MTVQRKLCFFEILLLALIFVWQIKAIWPFTIDDMYISLRYARHWAEGQGILWNLGALPVEGYSNFSFVLIAFLGIKLGIDPVILLKSLGVLSLALSGLGLAFICRLWFSWPLALLPCFWLFLYRGEVVWAVSGLESSFYQCLLLWASFFALRALGYQAEDAPQGTRFWFGFVVSSLLMVMASFTRIEAPAMAALMMLFFALNREKKGLLLFFASFMIFYLPYFFWRLYYYGKLLPNSYYCKGIEKGAMFLMDWQYIQLALPFLILAFFALWSRRDKSAVLFLGPSIVYLILLATASPLVAFFNRLFLPAFALLLPMALLGLSDLILFFTGEKNRLWNNLIYVLAGGICLLYIPWMSASGYRYFAYFPVKSEQMRARLVEWLDKSLPLNSKIVLADSGYIPYYSQHEFIDSYCLNNLNMAALPRESMYQIFCQNILKKHPDAVILTSLKTAKKIIYSPADQCLLKQLEKNHYRLKIKFESTQGQMSYRYEIFLPV